nr:V-type Ig domain protein [Oriental turtle dovepox virus]
MGRYSQECKKCLLVIKCSLNGDSYQKQSHDYMLHSNSLITRNYLVYRRD